MGAATHTRLLGRAGAVPGRGDNCMLVDGRVRDLGDRAYLLSPQDLAAYDLIDA